MDTQNTQQYYDSHYCKIGLQPIELMQMALTKEEFLGFLKGNVIKYSMRAGLKDGESKEKDETKRDRYYEWYLKAERGERINPRE